MTEAQQKIAGSAAPKEDDLKASEAPLIEHLTELRTRLIYSIIALAVLFILCFFVADQIYGFLLGPFVAAAGSPEAVRLIYTAPQEFFFTKLSVALFSAIFLAFPIIASQIYAFVAPGLYKNERLAFLPYLVATPICFLVGAALVYYGVMPLALGFFLGMQQTDPSGVTIEMVTRVSEYLSLIMTLLLAFGVCFQLPVILTLLAQIGLIGVDNLKAWRKYAIVAIIVIAAFLTPPDPISQIGLAIPLLLLYELSVFAVRIVEKRRLEREAQLAKDLED
ncbi:MAG TPA: twin-arginine translocase subunit TatC [Pelagibacterium sp.]|uniref:twin-arginine translocase subunit TatC n=1 Tax=uncultured Pelagibacterium sp. TaxID=1159875 RepID=UPI000C4146B5|nr:twin-arginine translocase subunit TatC [Pelagibacterium sp.]HCO54630.1 twin-arginine translocase subunit TatC [Pelagibacterium sp.]|tara:strand:+ start:2171 stop:3004 length:834 start_codon:yes stop_codon:yes gene_type:complete